MNQGIVIATILSLLLAVAATGNSPTRQAAVGDGSSSTHGHNLNHNETLVRDAQ